MARKRPAAFVERVLGDNRRPRSGSLEALAIQAAQAAQAAPRTAQDGLERGAAFDTRVRKRRRQRKTEMDVVLELADTGSSPQDCISSGSR